MEFAAPAVSRDRYNTQALRQKKPKGFKRSLSDAAAAGGVKAGTMAGFNSIPVYLIFLPTLKSQVVEDLGRLLRRNCGGMQWPQHAWGRSLRFSHPC
jgi:hypothetical protein